LLYKAAHIFYVLCTVIGTDTLHTTFNLKKEINNETKLKKEINNETKLTEGEKLIPELRLES